jgi:hypothetical protein
VLRKDNFLLGLPDLRFANELGIRWMTDVLDLSASGTDGGVRIRMTQSPPVESISNFEIAGETSGAIQFDKGSAYLDFIVNGAIGKPRALRLYHDGRHDPRIGIRVGREFAPVFFISSDGARVRLAYRDSQFNPHVAIVYLRDPATLYELGEKVACPFPNEVEGISSAFRVIDVRFLRPIERLVQRVGTTYDVGRLGAEIALAVAKSALGLMDTVMIEPSQPGADLFSSSGRSVIQARLIIEAHQRIPSELKELTKKEISDMLRSLGRDMIRMPWAQTGYVILSLTKADWTTQTLVIAITKQP